MCIFVEVSRSCIINLHCSSSVPTAPPPPISLQCIGHIARLMLQSPDSLQQPALKLMADSGDQELLQLTLDQIGAMTAVSLVIPGAPC